MINAIVNNGVFMFVIDYFKMIFTVTYKTVFILFVLINLPLICSNLYVRYEWDSPILKILFMIVSTILYWFLMTKYVIL